MPPTEHRYVRPAILVNYDSRTPSPQEWVAVETPSPAPVNPVIQWFKDNCPCDCTGDRNEAPKCVIS